MGKRGKIIPFPRPRPVLPVPEVEPELAEVHRCDQAEAMVVKGLLESAGIPALLRSRLVASVHPFSVGDQGEVVVLVPTSEVARCRLLLEVQDRRRPDGAPTPSPS